MGLGAVIGGVAKSVGDVAIRGIGMVSGSKQERDKQASDLRVAGLDQFGKEFQYSKDGWFDSLMDGINRIPRPFGFFAVIGFMVWVGRDPDAALAFAQNMTSLPVWFQAIISSVILFFYGARPIEKHFSRRFRKSDQQAITKARENVAIASIQNPTPKKNDPFVDVIGDDIHQLSNLEQARRANQTTK